MMQKRIVLAGAAVAVMLVPCLFAVSAGAIDVLNQPGLGSGPCDNTNATATPEICRDNRSNLPNADSVNPIFGPNGILTTLMNTLSIIIGIVAVIIIIIEGLRIIFAGSDAGTVANARRGIVYALAGLVVALSAQGVIALVLNRL